jgi:hypothetical protein
VKLAHQALTQFIADSRDNPLGEDESRAIVRRVLDIPGELAVSRQPDASRRLAMLAALNASNECLRRRRAQLGPNAQAVLSAIKDLSRAIALQKVD